MMYGQTASDNKLPKYQEILTDIIFDLLIEPGVSIDAELISEIFSRQCPGRYKLTYQSRSDGMFDLSDLVSSIKIEFDDQTDKIEWMLRWG